MKRRSEWQKVIDPHKHTHQLRHCVRTSTVRKKRRVPALGPRPPILNVERARSAGGRRRFGAGPGRPGAAAGPAWWACQVSGDGLTMGGQEASLVNFWHAKLTTGNLTLTTVGRIVQSEEWSRMVTCSSNVQIIALCVARCGVCCVLHCVACCIVCCMLRCVFSSISHISHTCLAFSTFSRVGSSRSCVPSNR